jgi:hypothetical protein
VLNDVKVTKICDHKLELSPDLWELIQGFVHVRSPFKEFTELVSGDSYISLSLVYPKLRILRRLLEDVDDEDEMVGELKHAIRKKLDEKFGNGMVSGKACVALIATGLDPKRKALKCVNSENREKVKDQIVDLTKCIIDKQTADQDRDGESAEPPAKRVRHASQLESSSSDDDDIPLSSSSTRFLAIHEYENFRKDKKPEDDQCTIKWWKANQSKFPNMSILARKYLSIPATSTPSERVFSAAGIICTKLRASLAPENIDMLIFLAKNRDIIASELNDNE